MDRNSAECLVKTTLTQPFDEPRFRLLTINLLEGLDEDKAFHWVAGSYIRDAFKDHVKKYRRLGTYTDPQGRKVELLVVHLKNPWALERSRSTQRNFVAEYLKQRGEKDAALIAYHTDEPTDWRFSFVRMEYREEITPDGRVKVKEAFTPSRRYSFLVGQSEPSHTAQQQLVPLLEEVAHPTLDQIEQAFSVERVTKQFYTDYRDLFEQVRDALDAIVETDVRVRDEFAGRTVDPANFAKKLLGQLVFLYFLQKKGWLGVGRDAQGNLMPWGEGPKDFLRRLHQKDYVEYANFFDDVLEPLFYEALATERADDFYSPFRCRIPFLNGGLFEPLNGYNWREVDIRLPNDLIQEILDTFDRYNFTVREDDPLDREVAVDPEMLGKVFENLLPENLRKGKGSYYTPRSVVHFMCQESLIHYLDGAVNRGETPLVFGHEKPRLVDAGEPEQMALQGEGRAVRVPREDLEEFIRRGEFSQEMDAATASGTKSHKFRIPESVRTHAKAIDATLAAIRVCDPAVGSGAFLVGMMHEIVKARSLLTVHLAGREKRSAYELKRHAIHNALYGVDIDAGAVDIAKLRLWLSLVVDEDEYASIHPLPNLDYKVMQGNSLFEDFHDISLAPDEQADEGTLLRKDQGLVERIEALHQTQSEYFNATHHSDKRRLREAVEAAVLDVFTYAIEKQNKAYYDALAAIEKEVAKLPDALRIARRSEQLAKLKERFAFDPDQLTAELREMTHGNKLRDFFPWRLYFADVFQERGGFDVVIANPPYVRQERITDQKARLKTVYPDVYHGVADIYVYFYRKAFDIAMPSGTVTFISSNKYFRAGYGKTLRAYLKDQASVHLVIDFGDLPVFDATTYPCVVLAGRAAADLKTHEVRVANVRSLDVLDALSNYVETEGWDQPQRSLLKEGWVLACGNVRALVDKLRSAGTPLGEHVGGRFYYGIKTGCNEAFVIDAATRDRLVEEDARSAEIIKPWLRGKDVKRWRVAWQEQYLVWTYKGVPIDNYPAVLAYLSQYREKLAKRWEPSRGQCEWYELRPCDYYAEFEKPRIVYQEIATFQSFAFTREPYYLNNKCFMIPVEDAYLLGILNSHAAWFFLKSIVSKLQGSAHAMQSPYLSQVPIPDANTQQRAGIEALVRRLFNANGEGPQAAEWEQELSALIYRLYNLVPEEIRIIEEATQ